MKRSLLMLAGLGMAVGVILAGLNIATAQETPTTTPDKPVPVPPPVEKAPLEKRFPKPGRFDHFGPGPFGGGPFGHKFGRAAIHGEFTTPAPDGQGFRTQAIQTGEVTAVSKSSITVKSEDGFTRNYVVNEETLVNAGRDGIDSVKTGDAVQLMAVVEGDTARAVHISDISNLRRLRERWWPARK